MFYHPQCPEQIRQVIYDLMLTGKKFTRLYGDALKREEGPGSCLLKFSWEFYAKKEMRSPELPVIKVQNGSNAVFKSVQY